MFTLHELLKATQGKLVRGNLRAKVKGISINSRTIKPAEAFLAIKGENFDGHDFIAEAIKKGSGCIISLPQKAKTAYRGIPLIEVRDTIKALGNIARFKRQKFNIPVIAITGSNGKTTAKEMVAQVLSRRFKVLKNEGTKNNQIGLPLTLLNLNRNHDIAVLEIGTNHFGEVKYLSKICQPNIGIITNIGPAHLEYFSSPEGVFKEKYALIENLKKPSLAILNADDPLLRKEVVKKTKKPVVLGFGIKNQSDFSASGIRVKPGKLEFLVKQKYKFTLKTIGEHNIYNALIAIAVGCNFGLGYKEISAELKDFHFPAGRLSISKLNQATFIDDTYNSNPVSLRRALDTLGHFKARGRKILVMGDMLELGKKGEFFHYQAGKDIAEVCDVLITVGEFSKLAAEAAGASGFALKNIFTCATSAEAGDILLNEISPRKDDIILVKGSRLMKMEEVFKNKK
jgi:UDP-N-acetylmuramoyl-tripeptide--D-alanyl-D-alanine ligase